MITNPEKSRRNRVSDRCATEDLWILLFVAAVGITQRHLTSLGVPRLIIVLYNLSDSPAR